MATINATPTRFENAGILELSDDAGSTWDTIENYVPGSLAITPGLRDALEYTDRGEQQVPLRGDEAITELSFDVYLTSDTGADELAEKLIADGSGATVTVYSVRATWRTYREAAIGKKVTIDNCYVPPGQLGLQSAADVDRMTIRMRSIEPFPAIAAATGL